MDKTAKNRLIAIFFGILMLGSTATYAIIQAYNLFGTNAQSTPKLPSSNIVQSQLSNDVEQLIQANGGTVVQFFYSTSCLDCVKQRNVLESYANQNPQQIYLEEIQTQNAVAQNIIMKSYRDTKILTSASESDIQNAFCDVLLNPPAACALRNLNTS